MAARRRSSIATIGIGSGHGRPGRGDRSALLVAGDLRPGAWEAPSAWKCRSPAVVLVCRKERRAEPRIARFRDWLIAQIEPIRDAMSGIKRAPQAAPSRASAESAPLFSSVGGDDLRALPAYARGWREARSMTVDRRRPADQLAERQDHAAIDATPASPPNAW